MKSKFNRRVLKNGLTVLHEKRDIPVASICFAVRYGAAYETADKKGIAHFIEHMVFKGTKKRTADQISNELEKIGGRTNAFTAEELTGFHVKLPSRHLDIGVEVLSDLFFCPVFDENELEKERKVILEEIKLHHDEPMRYVLDRIRELSYKKPFGAFAAGSEEVLKKVKREDLVRVHKQNYNPGNSILCVVSDNDFEEIVKLVEKIDVKNLKPVNEVKIERISDKVIEKRKGIKQATVVLSIPSVTEKDERRYAAKAFKTILGDGMSSKLHNEIREKRGLAYAVIGFLDSGKEFGDIFFYVGTENGKEKEVEKVLVDEIKKMKELSQAELDEAKEQLLGNYEIAVEDSMRVCISLISEEILGKAENYYDLVENVKKIRLGDVRSFADFKDYSSITLVPGD